MAKQLIIAEKPSLARNIMTAIKDDKLKKADGYFEGNTYIITYAIGHLFGLIDLEEYYPKDVREEMKGWTLEGLPFCPNEFRFSLKKDPKTKKTDTGYKKQFQIIKSLVERSDVEVIIHAGDADREGELIINNILKACGNKKRVMRLWLPEQTEKTIRHELKNLKDDKEYKNLNDEGEARTYIDWLYGINLTRLATIKTQSRPPLRVGRVIVPIVKAIYDRDMEIEHFIPEKYLIISSKEKTNGVVVELNSRAKFFGDDRFSIAQETADRYNSSKAVVKEVKKERKTIGPGKLYSLSKLQGVLGKTYKMSLKESLAIIQKLYEAGYVTYPRTNSEYLAQAESAKINEVIDVLKGMGYDVKPKDGNKQIYDDSKIESHSALTPTYKIPDLDKLSDGERKVYTTILNRFLAVFCATPCEVDRTTITISVGNLEDFKLKGDVYIKKGWKAYDNAKTQDKELPPLNEGDIVNIHFKPEEKETKPPAHYTTDTLNNYLKNPFRKEKKQDEDEKDDVETDEKAEFEDSEDYKAIFEGLELGTEATRTGIIDNAINSGYISLKDNHYYILPGGIFFIESLKALGINMDKYKTAELGKALKQVYRGEISVRDSVELANAEIEEVFKNAKGITVAHASHRLDNELLGKCPNCGADVYLGKFGAYCSAKCGMNLSKILGKSLTSSQVKKLLEGKKILFKGLTSNKTGKKYDAYIVPDGVEPYHYIVDGVEKSGMQFKFKMEFPKPKQSKGK